MEYVDVTVLEQMHRRTLGLLRHQVDGSALRGVRRVLGAWQHLAPPARLGGEGGLRRVLEQLRALPVAGQLWERDVLPLRLSHYDPVELESLSQSGELVWVGSGGGDPRRARVRFFFRGEGGAFLVSPPRSASVASTRRWLPPTRRPAGRRWRVLGGGRRVPPPRGRGSALHCRSACGVGIGRAGARDGAGGARHGRVGHQRQRRSSCADSSTGARGSPSGIQPSRASISSVEQQLARRLSERHRHPKLGRRPTRVAMRAADQRVRLRLGADRGAVWPGRWALVHRSGIMGPPLAADERALRQARQLLLRWGIVTRMSLEREEGSWGWGPVYRQLQRLEMRGEVRRGYFVRGLPGVQFALPEAVEALRAAGARAPTEAAASGHEDRRPRAAQRRRPGDGVGRRSSRG